MKKLLFFLLAFLTLLFSPKDVLAYEQTQEVCYAQCAAYKFGWKGDFCWDLFQSQCSVGSKDMVNNMISLVKDTAEAMATGKLMTIVDVSAVFKGWFMCKPLIDDCIVPQLSACESTCKDVSQTYYAPNLSVGTAYTNETNPSVFYSEERHELIFKVVNDGPGYAWDIDVTASWGHTPNRDKIVSGGGTLFTEKIPELLFLGARIGSPKEPADSVVDFLIDESNLSGLLSKYKSDANNHYIPPVWYKSVPFTAPEGEYTKVIFNVDPNKMIPESGEGDNTFIYEIDKLPTPFSLTVENLAVKRTDPNSLTEYLVSFQLKNSGEDSGNANIKWYEGNYESGKSPIYEQNKVIQGLNQVSVDQAISVDVTKGGDSCNYSQNYTIVVFDSDGFIKTRHEFSIPLYAGSIMGRVEDLFGKKIVGATVTASTGQTSIVDEYGFYHIKGIAALGKVTLTVTHPDFSKSETKEVEIKYIENKDKCRVDGLSPYGVNFVLKDQGVIFTVTLKDTLGNPVNGHVLATNKVSDNAEISGNNFRLDKDINGTGELGALQPGEYMFTISAGSYKTIAQNVSAVPDKQNLEFVLEPILGRSNDGTMVIQTPQLLWQWDRGVEILSQVSATKDGKRVILYTTKNKLDTGKLYFLDAITGNQTKVNNISGVGGQSRACLDTSYDGNTTAILVRNEIAKEIGNILTLFNNQGNEFAKTDYLCKTSGCASSDCSVSSDGFYIFPGFLINKSLYAYSRLEIEGIGGYSHMGYSSMGPLYFLHGNGLIAGCKEHGDGDQCAQYVNHTEITRFSGLKGSIRVVDSSFNDQRVIFGAFDKLSLYGGGTKVFEKDVNAAGGQEPSSSISMGGQYIIYTYNEPKTHNADFKIVTADNVDKTPSFNKDVNENVIFVHANDKGLFYLVEKGKTLKYYQVGKYTTEYNPGIQTTPPPPLKTTNLSMHINGNFSPAGEKSYSELDPGFIYRADKTLTLNIFGNGSRLHILEGTIFSLDGGRQPILLKGQITADFDSPVTIYAIKFDRFDLALFRSKLNQFWRIRTLPESEYFVVNNIHTKFTVNNDINKFNVAVEDGQVKVLADKTEKTINSGKQITIDATNNIKESNYIGSRIYLIFFGILILVLSIFLFIKRKPKVGGKSL